MNYHFGWPKKPISKRQIGKLWEDQALDVLRKKGYRFLAANYYTRWGEIDLILLDGKELVFVEVKKKSDLRYGFPEEAVDKIKRKRLCRAALVFLSDLQAQPKAIRFDVVAFGPDTVNHYRHAFFVEDEFYM